MALNAHAGASSHKITQTQETAEAAMHPILEPNWIRASYDNDLNKLRGRIVVVDVWAAMEVCLSV
eukprot:5025358-Amphidinium_carterae.1